MSYRLYILFRTIFAGVFLVTTIGCTDMSPKPHMTGGEDEDYGLLDEDAISFMSDGSDNEEVNNLIRSERSLNTILKDGPNDAVEAYAEAVAFEEKMMELINSVANQRSLKLSQVANLERQIARIKVTANLCKEERKRMEREVKANIDLILSDSNEQDHCIKCKGCKRQMNTSRALLFMLNNEVWGNSTWTLCDAYGNTKADSPVYDSLAAILNAHNSKTHHVSNCAYCYKETAIENSKDSYQRTKIEHNSLRIEYHKLANSTNRSTRRFQKLKTELLPQTQRKIHFYNSQIEAYRNSAIAMESLRHNAVLDYEAVQYGPSESWRSTRDE